MKFNIIENIESRNQKFYKTTQIAYKFGFLGHLGGLIVFLFVGIIEMVWFNAFISLPAFLLAVIFNRKGFHNLAFAFAFFELLFHQIAGIYFLGWEAGFQYWFIYLAALCFFNPHWKGVIRLILLVIVGSNFILFYLFYDGAVYQLSELGVNIAFLINSVSSLMVTALLISYYSLSALRAENELLIKNEEIHNQREQIIQSITYAEKIQKATLPKEGALAENFADFFIYFRPKDIVSGDFYWFSDVGDKTIVVCADCTGHGVPGGFMSMLGISLLNELVNHQKICSPALILELMRKKVKESLSQTGKSNEQKDGMDMSICVFDNQLGQMSFAGANNSIIIIKDGELKEFKTTRNPIGVYKKEIPFEEASFSVEKGTQIYQFTDGYVDQFGGSAGKKFMKKNLKCILQEIYNLPMDEQKSIIATTFKEWKNNYEQLDDVSIVAVQV